MWRKTKKIVLHNNFAFLRGCGKGKIKSLKITSPGSAVKKYITYSKIRPKLWLGYFTSAHFIFKL